MDTLQLQTYQDAGASSSGVVRLVLDGLDSPHTRRAYERALTDFMGWHERMGRPALTKALVQRYASELREAGASAASINQRLSAIRKLAREAADNDLLPQALANGIANVQGVKQEGQRLGNWLNKDQAQALINSPDVTTVKGRRDRALLAVLIGCGLRRAEAARLTFAHIQQRDGRWVIVDLVGKRNRTRSVPMPSWAKAAIDAWGLALGDASGYVFRPVNKGDKVSGEQMTAQAIFNTLKTYAGALGVDVAPHDLRRTYAKLAHKGGAPLEQIQLSLGHASIQTTERYLGVEQDLTNAPCDFLGLRLEA